MLHYREKKNVILEQKKEERRQRGEHVRQQMEEKKTAERTTVVHNLEVCRWGLASHTGHGFSMLHTEKREGLVSEIT